ncbi:hypothetical protein PN498_07440 [Oscillatoria sp. CS-180]|uniref:hypothetical protein n=1 Tax=Oscillatoria sp. CS-180 TaxID=3021720 RepID=UPI00232C9B80|nr:hypothetical protein [Oscillatoria sp. CS-180]MDB9525814.1 hypothetical protein [Oscillatoria sp. CS-180]
MAHRLVLTELATAILRLGLRGAIALMVSAQTPPSKDQPSKARNFRRFLHPSWLAGAISIGFHSVLFAASPTFQGLAFNDLIQPEPEAEQRDVPLIELSAAEQQRLPDFSGSLYSFDTFNDLESLSPLIEGDELRSSAGDSPTARGSSSPLTRRRSVNTQRIPFGVTNLESRLRDYSGTSSGGRTSNQNEADAAATDQATADGSAADLEANSSDATADTSEGQASSENIAALPDTNPTEVMNLEETLLAYTYDETGTAQEESDVQREAWLEVGQTHAEALGSEGPAMADAAEETEDEAEETAPTEQGQVSDEETPDAAEGPADAAENSPADIVKEPIELTIDHSQGVCLTEAPQPGLVGAWIGPNGTLLDKPEVLRSTGYPGFNNQAVEYIQTLDFSSVNALTGYQFAILVEYDAENCVNLGRNTPESTSAEALQEPEESDAASKEPLKEADEAPSIVPPTAETEPSFEPLPTPEADQEAD